MPSCGLLRGGSRKRTIRKTRRRMKGGEGEIESAPVAAAETTTDATTSPESQGNNFFSSFMPSQGTKDKVKKSTFGMFGMGGGKRQYLGGKKTRRRRTSKKGGKRKSRGGVIFTATSPDTQKVLDEISQKPKQTKKTKRGGKKTRRRKSRKSRKTRK